jgi:hypothetical protein
MRHNKKTNIYLIYNSLIRTISKAMTFENIENSKDAIIAKEILYKYFKKGVLKEYIHVGNIINNSNFSKTEKLLAVEMLKETEGFVQAFDTEDYRTEKINLLKEVKKFFNLDKLLEYKFINYKTLASIHMFIEHSMGEKNIFSIENQVKIRYTLAENMLKTTKKTNQDALNYIKANKIDDYTLKLANTAFAKNLEKLNESDKVIINSYLNEDLHSYIANVRKAINKNRKLIEEFNIYNDNIELKKRLNTVLKETFNIKIDEENINQITEKLFDLNEIVTVITKNTKESYHE